MVVRLPMCVRLGPMTPIITGLPLIMWQPTHPPCPVDSSLSPRSALPTALLKGRPTGVGVFGIVHAGSFSRGYETKPACCTVAADAAAESTAPGVCATAFVVSGVAA